MISLSPFAEVFDPLESSGGEREHARALLLACRHLPGQLASPGQRSSMLSEASKMFEKLGDKKSHQECRNLLLKFRSTASLCTSGGPPVFGSTAPIPVC